MGSTGADRTLQADVWLHRDPNTAETAATGERTLKITVSLGVDDVLPRIGTDACSCVEHAMLDFVLRPVTSVVKIGARWQFGSALRPVLLLSPSPRPGCAVSVERCLLGIPKTRLRRNFGLIVVSWNVTRRFGRPRALSGGHAQATASPTTCSRSSARASPPPPSSAP